MKSRHFILMNSFIALVLTKYIDYRIYIGQVKFEPPLKENMLNFMFHCTSGVKVFASLQ